MHVFTYGTLMFPQVWRTVVGKYFATVEGSAAGFEVYRVRDAVFPGMTSGEFANAAQGVVYLNVDIDSLERLDRFEDDFYTRLPIEIACADGQRRMAEAYIVPKEHCEVLTDELWTGESFLASGGLEKFTQGFAGFGRVEEGGSRGGS